MNKEHRWQEHIPQDVLDSPVVGQVYEFAGSSIVSWVSTTTTPSRPVEKWVSELDRVVQQFAEALAQGRRSLETRVEDMEKELSALKTRFRMKEEQDKALVAEITSIDDTGVGPDGADPLSLLPSGKELEELLRDYDR